MSKLDTLKCFLLGHDWVDAIQVGEPEKSVQKCDRCDETRESPEEDGKIVETGEIIYVASARAAPTILFETEEDFERAKKQNPPLVKYSGEYIPVRTYYES